jgi:hypothetical protein
VTNEIETAHPDLSSIEMVGAGPTAHTMAVPSARTWN